MVRSASLKLVFPLAFALAACGGGTTSVVEDRPGTAPVTGPQPEPEPGIVVSDIDFGPAVRQFAGDAPITPASYVGRVFPFPVVGGFATSTIDQSAGMGYVSVLNDDQFVLSIPGNASVLFTRVSPGSQTFSAPGPDPSSLRGARLVEYEGMRYLRGRWITNSITDFAGIHGFQTPDDRLRGRAVYTIDNVDIGWDAGLNTFELRTTGELVADFGSGTVAGTLDPVSYRASPPPFLNVLPEERLVLTLGMEGSIVRGGFTGTMNGSAVLTRGTQSVDTDLQLSNTNLRGTFFGPTGESVGGIFEGDFAHGNPVPTLGDPLVPGTFVGAFGGARD